MSRDAVDETLAGLGAAHDRIAAAMFAVDSHPGLAFLRSGGLAGATQARWDALRPEVDLLWAHFALLGDLLERARGIRGQRRPDDADWAALRQIAGEPIVGLDAAGLPTDSGAPATRVRLWDLAQRLEHRCATVTGHLADVDSAWRAVAGRYAPLTEAVDTVVAQAATVGLDELAQPLSTALSDAARTDLGDPLSAAPGGRLAPLVQQRLTDLSDRLATVRERVAALVAVRDGYPGRVAELTALLDGAAAAERGLGEVYARVIEKIADPGLPPLPSSAAVLRARLGDLDTLRRESRWGELVDAAAALEAQARRATERAEELRSAADGLLGRRDELRGRLDAYRAKAARLGYAEHDELTLVYGRARDLLYVAPCDLRAATRAVFAYQQTLATLPGATLPGAAQPSGPPGAGLSGAAQPSPDRGGSDTDDDG
jgi:hypothetical protein